MVARTLDDFADVLAYCRQVSRLGDHLDVTEISRYIDALLSPDYVVDPKELARRFPPPTHDEGERP